jgi:hypothetical protein
MSLTDSTAHLLNSQTTTSLASIAPPPGLDLSTSLKPKSQEIAFIDTATPDYQQLVAGIAPGTEIHILDATQDAIAQITQTLLGRQGISSLHIISHGQAGGLDLGGQFFNLQSLPSYTQQLQSWQSALTTDADIVLYGLVD